MPYTVKVKTPPAEEPVTIDEVKEFLKVSGSDDDSLLDVLRIAARQEIEGWLRRALITQTLELHLDDFYDGIRRHIRLPNSPVQSVGKIEYFTRSGSYATVDASIYEVDLRSDPARVFLARGKSWPTDLNDHGPVTIEYTAGYGNSSDVPQAIKNGIMMAAGQTYQNRNPLVVQEQIGDVSVTYREAEQENMNVTLSAVIRSIIGPYRLVWA